MKKLLIPTFIMCASLHGLAQTNIGLQLYTFRNQFKTDVPGTFQKIHDMGIHYIEGGSTYGMSMPDFKQLMDKFHLETVSVGADFKELSDNPQLVVDRAKALGAHYVMCAWVPHEKTFSPDDAKKAVEVFNRAGKILHDNGLVFCYHAHGYEFGADGKENLFDYMMQHMNPVYANFEMDVFWMKHPGQDPVALLKKYPGRFKLMHLKDRKKGTPDGYEGKAPDETNVVLGSGDVGIAAIMKEARKQGIKYYFIEDESPLSMEQVPLSLAYLKSLK